MAGVVAAASNWLDLASNRCRPPATDRSRPPTIDRSREPSVLAHPAGRYVLHGADQLGEVPAEAVVRRVFWAED